jgi:hypothetical protein
MAPARGRRGTVDGATANGSGHHTISCAGHAGMPPSSDQSGGGIAPRSRPHHRSSPTMKQTARRRKWPRKDGIADMNRP